MNGFVTLLVTALLCPTVAKSGVYRRIRRKRGGQNLFQAALCAIVCLVYHRVFRCNLDYLPRIRAAATGEPCAYACTAAHIYDCAVCIVCDRSAGVSLCVACKRQHPSEDRHGGIQYASACDPCDQPQCRLYGGRISWRGPWAGAAFALAVFLIHAGFTCWIVTIRSQRPFKERRRFLFMFLCWRLRSLVFPADPCLYNCRTVPEALCFYQ